MVMPYLNFTGNCEEAFRLYQRAFGAPAPLLARYADAPADPAHPMDAAQLQKIMHGHLMLTETGGISGADAIWPVQSGSAVSIHVLCKDAATAQHAFNTLAEGGAIVGPLQPNPPPHDAELSGNVVDRFGFSWVLSAPRG